MGDPKVFVSSTGLDLGEYRKAAMDVCRQLDLHVVAMEDFEAMGVGATEGSLAKLDEADVYVGFFAHRYGYIEDGYAKSVTHLEFDGAEERGLERLCFLADPNFDWKPALMDPNREAIEAFKKALDKRLIRAQFTTVPDFKLKLYRALERWKKEHAPEKLGDAGTAPRPLQIPPPPPDFTGRTEELAEILAAIRQGNGDSGVVIFGLKGMGGIGKSVLAFKIAEHVADRYPDGQLFLDLRGTDPDPPQPEELMAEAIRSLAPEARLPDESKQLPPIYRAVLRGKRLILLADNAAGKSQTEPLTPPSGCLFLVTSRRQFHIPGLQSRNLDVLSTEDAAALVQRICPRVSQAEAESLAERVGRLPLAVRLAASALEVRQDWTPAEYLDRLADARERLGLGGEEESVEASISLSWDLLSKEDRALLAQLSVFPAPFDRAAVTALWELEEDPADDALGRLQDATLVQWDLEAHRYRLHDLVRDFLAEELGEEERQEAYLRYGAHYLAVLRTASHLYDAGNEDVLKGLALFDRERVHIETGFARSRDRMDVDDRAAELVSGYPVKGRMVLVLRQTPSEQIEWLEAGLAAARRLENRNREAAHLGNLANAHYALGDYDRAEELYRQALQPLGEAEDRKGQATAYHRLGMVAQDRGSYEEALEQYRKALAINEELGNRAGMASSYHELGRVAQARGSYEEALDWYRKSLEIEEELGNRAGMASSYHNLGAVAQERGAYEEALEQYRKALAINEELGNRAGMASTICALGILATVQGRPETGMPLNLRSLGIDLEIGSPERRFNLPWLTRQREMLGEERFGEILAENLDEESREAVLGLLAEYGKSQDGEGGGG